MKRSGLIIILTLLMITFSFSRAAQAATELEYYEQGVDLFNQGNYEEALHNFEAAGTINPHESVYFDWQGSCLYHMVALDEALLAFDKALALEPYYTTFEYKGYVWLPWAVRRKPWKPLTKALPCIPIKTTTSGRQRFCWICKDLTKQPAPIFLLSL